MGWFGLAENMWYAAYGRGRCAATGRLWIGLVLRFCARGLPGLRSRTIRDGWEEVVLNVSDHTRVECVYSSR